MALLTIVIAACAAGRNPSIEPAPTRPTPRRPRRHRRRLQLARSPRHPLPDGRLLGDLRAGDLVDGSLVVGADLVDRGLPRTFELLPSGGTGTYWANAFLLGNTLASAPVP